MKCIRCGVDSAYRERRDGRCRSCNAAFAFEPREGGLMTDAAFKAAIDAVSASGRVRWGVEHLYYELWRRLGRRRRQLRLGALPVALLVGVVVFWHENAPWIAAGGAAIVAALWLVGWFAWSRTLPLSPARFDALWQRWNHVHGAPEGVIARKPPAQKQRAAEPDLADYSFDRAVICDRARTVDLLLANNFHFENNCAVLAIGGYPPGPFETVRAMLKRNPRLQVFTLHDATPEGCQMAHRLARDPAWFGGTIPVVDVGLRPEHARPLSRLWLPAQDGPVTAGGGVGPAEADWLARHRLELAAIRPEQVLKRLFRAINKKPEAVRANPDEPLDAEYDSSSFGSDAEASDGGGDSFG